MELWTMMMAGWLGLFEPSPLTAPPTAFDSPSPPGKCAGLRFRSRPPWIVMPCEPARVEEPGFQTQAVLSAQGLVSLLAGRRSSFLLDVTVDRHDGGRYTIGDPVEVRGTSAEAGFLHLLHLDPQGEVRLLYPRAGEDHSVRAGENFEIGKERRFVASATAGSQRIRAVVTAQPLLLTSVPRSGGNASEAGALAAADLQRILGRFAQDEVLFYVEPAASAQPTKTSNHP